MTGQERDFDVPIQVCECGCNTFYVTIFEEGGSELKCSKCGQEFEVF